MKNKLITALLTISSLLIASPIKAEYIQPQPISLNTFSKECTDQINNVNKELISKESGVKRGYEMYDGGFKIDSDPEARYYPKDQIKQTYDLWFKVYSGSVMKSPKLQLYWANLVNSKCSEYFHTIAFSVPQTDYDIYYLQKNGVMVPSYKETPVVEGLPYSKARQIILNEGWVPASFNQSEVYGYEQFVVSLGYDETFSCAGTGQGNCVFYFENPDETSFYLTVVTVGQFDEQGHEGIVRSIKQDYSLGGLYNSIYN